MIFQEKIELLIGAHPRAEKTTIKTIVFQRIHCLEINQSDHLTEFHVYEN